MNKQFIVIYDDELSDEEINRATTGYPAGSMSLGKTMEIHHMLSFLSWLYSEEGEEPLNNYAGYIVSNKSLIDLLIFTTDTKYVLCVDNDMIRTCCIFMDNKFRLDELMYATEQLTNFLPSHRNWMAISLRQQTATKNVDSVIDGLDDDLRIDAKALRVIAKEFLAPYWHWRDAA